MRRLTKSRALAQPPRATAPNPTRNQFRIISKPRLTGRPLANTNHNNHSASLGAYNHSIHGAHLKSMVTTAAATHTTSVATTYSSAPTWPTVLARRHLLSRRSTWPRAPADVSGQADGRARGAARAGRGRDPGHPPASGVQGADMIGKTIAELTPGDRAEITRVVEQSDIASFVEAVGDFSPVHSDRPTRRALRSRSPSLPASLPGQPDLGRHRHPAAGAGRHSTCRSR